MTQPDPPKPLSADTLRRQAEARLQDTVLPVGSAPHDTQRLLHELQVHQVELELQNEELTNARDAAEEAIARYSDLYDFAPMGYLTLNRTGNITQANLAAAQLLDSERARLIGKRLGTWFAETALSTFNTFLQQSFVAGVQSSGELELHVKDQVSTVQIESSLSDDGQECRLVLVNITTQKKQQQSLEQSNSHLKREIKRREQAENERRTLETQLRQSQKLEALGKLTGGIAHDYNNMLGIIIGYSDLLKVHLQDQPKLMNYINAIHHAGERAAKFNTKILSFTSNYPVEASNVNINNLLMEQQDMLRKTLTYHIALIFDLSSDLWPVWLDNSGLEDTILNISINAMHAMLDTDDAKLTIQTRNKSIDAQYGKTLGLDEGDYVKFSFTDNGKGMNSVTKECIFDPFFTTKGQKGTGLGLSQVFGFVKNSGGTIKVISGPGKGSQFSLYLPRYLGDDIDESVEIKTVIYDSKGNESILIVDDETALGQLTSEILRQQGYKTMVVTSGKKALETLEQKHIDLMLTDIIMPEMDGYQLAAIVQDKFPDVKIQLVSGFSDARHSDLVDEKLLNELINKPYNEKDLLKNIRQLLDKRD